MFDYNFFGEHSIMPSTSARCPSGGRSSVCGSAGSTTVAPATLEIDGDDCGTLELPTIMRIISSLGSSVGRDHGSQVSTRYGDEFPFAGRLERLDVQLVSERTADTAAAEARAIMGRQ